MNIHGICHIKPGGCLPYHSHEASELYFPLKGSFTLFFDGHVRNIIGGTNREAIYIPSNCPHGLRNQTSEAFEFFFFYYAKNGEKANPNQLLEHFEEKAMDNEI